MERWEPPEEEPPYDLNAEIINIADQDYGFWYIDVQEHPERYVNKLVRFRAKGIGIETLPRKYICARKKCNDLL